MQRTVIACLIMGISLVMLGTGCEGPVSHEDTRTPAQYFREQQKATLTPNGKIRTESVAEKDGKIQYQTEDGKRWQVGYSKRTDGTYDYRTPEDLP